jgi:hypothetical protein
MRVFLCPCDKSSVSLSSGTRETALSDGSHRLDVIIFYVMTELQPVSKCHASSLRQLFFIMQLIEVLVIKSANYI